MDRRLIGLALRLGLPLLLALGGCSRREPHRPPSHRLDPHDYRRAPVEQVPSSRPAPDRVLSDGCLGCHDENLLAQQRLTRPQWAAVVKKMRGWGAPVADAEVEGLVELLATWYGPAAPPFVAGHTVLDKIRSTAVRKPRD